MNVKTMVTTATLLLAVWTPAAAQTSQNGQTVREILNRAQSQSDRKAVEDLIGRLRGSAPAELPPQPTLSSPVPSAAAPAPESPTTAPTDTTIETAVPSPTEPQPSTAVLATEPSTAAGSPSIPDNASASAPALQSAAPYPTTVTVIPPAATLEPKLQEEVRGAAEDAPLRPTPVTAAPPTVAPPEPVVAPADIAETAPAGAPAAPVEALPGPVGPTEAEIARAPALAREHNLPTVDIEVLFAYDSSEVTPAAAESLTSLGRALADPRLTGQRFIIAGHTDSRGARSYNLTLSDRRARAVRGFLIEHFKIAPENLVARGFGESQPRNSRNPRAPENRRVQVINWSAQTAGEPRR